MAVKAVFKNETGSIIVDNTYKNLQHIGKKTQVAGNSKRTGIGNPPWFYGIHSPEGVIYSPAYNPWWVQANNAESTRHGFYLSRDCEWHYFGTKQFVKANPGLNLYNDDGTLFFSSNFKPLRVIDFIDGTFAKAEDIINGKVISDKNYGSRKLAVIVGHVPYRYYATGTLYLIAPKITTTLAGRVKIEMAQAGTASSGSYRGNLYTLRYNFLVVDVTDY